MGPRSAQSMIWRWIWGTWSCTILVSVTFHFPLPSFSMTSLRTSSDLSVEGSLDAVVETIRIATLRGASVMAEIATMWYVLRKLISKGNLRNRLIIKDVQPLRGS
ncbi:hypothetical protein CH063_03527 [Colletotrichum higginsianum]|uniref:Uncharacterized protein n=1 Tax=Colletotrichum higginsianum (strain IMI 349063) TaxID=759273 RepID=H1VY63_COLHI|nr:hypothetical protein CH063_03527 [Colletotrichum higginsianum]